MSDRESILARLRQALPSLKQHYPIRSLGLFGSTARGDGGDASDIDILVEFTRPVSLSTFLALEDELRRLLGRSIDLVSQQALKPHVRRTVAHDLVKV
jgi:predicted nucleotidyltransferase